MKRLMMKANRGVRYGAAGLACLAVLLAYLRWHGQPKPGGTAAEKIETRVVTVQPRRETVRRTVEQPGQIEGFERTALYAKIAGFVRAYQVDIGDRVCKGQLLAELWVPELVEDLHQKDAMVVQDEAQICLARETLHAAEADVLRAEANLRLSEASRIRAEGDVVRWNLQYRRDARMLQGNAVSKEDFDKTVDQSESARAAQAETLANVAAAKAALAQSKAQRDKAAAGVKVAEAGLRVAEAERARAAAILSYARIEAPYDGIVSRRGIDTGTYVEAPSGGKGAGTPLFEVVRTDKVRIFVDVPEADASFARDTGPAWVRVQALGDREFPGSVTRSSWLLDAQTRTLRTEIDLPNPDGLFRPGMYAYARLPLEHPGALTLPTSAVFHQDDQDWVVRIEGDRALRTVVQVGVRDGKRVEVLRRTRKAANEPGAWVEFTGVERIVRDSPSTYADGQEVQTQPDSGRLVSELGNGVKFPWHGLFF